MTSRLIHIDAYQQGVRTVKITGIERWYLLVEMPDKSEARVYLSNTLRSVLKSHLREIDADSFDSVVGLEIEAVKSARFGVVDYVQWQVRKSKTTSEIPHYLLKQ